MAKIIEEALAVISSGLASVLQPRYLPKQAISRLSMQDIDGMNVQVLFQINKDGNFKRANIL